MEIGIVGFGVVGNVTVSLLKKEHKIHIFDPDIGHVSNLSECEIIFICVNEKEPDMGNLDKLINELIKINKKAVFVIRTTIIPGTTDRYIKTHNRDFVYMPEFVREWNIEYDTFHPDKIVIGTENIKLWEILWGMFSHFIEADRIIRVKPIEAELAKLAINSLALIKVVFTEELYDLTKILDIDYQNIYKIFSLDENINIRHLLPMKDGYRGAGGKCLPKDSDFLTYTGRLNDNILSLLETAIMMNSIYLRVNNINDNES